ncbi:MAG: LysR substrate-binding domain-containing protein [Flavobacteriaceae bacterium]|nr:LysR substrate-binding domain-containing protein [Flavobacteriaceae bacterium]|tara:strand:- start:29 stop:985 length:957 start_codon:yes stop_codon:yes gene_type:complete
MTIVQLKYAIAVAEHRNFTVAADKCFVTQPTLSMQIQKLEAELDITIFDRTKKPIAISDVGIKIIQQCKKIVSESEKMQDVVDQDRGVIGGNFKIGIVPTIMPTLLPLFLDELVSNYPMLKVLIYELPTNELINQLKNNRLDLIIASTPLEDDDLIEKPIYYEPFVAYLPKSNEHFGKKEIVPRNLYSNDLLLLRDGHCFRNSIENLCFDCSEYVGKFELKSGSFETLVNLVDQNLGITFLPYLHTLKLNENQKEMLHNFKNPKPAREVSLVYHKSEVKIHIIDEIKKLLFRVTKQKLHFSDVNIISPIKNREAKRFT